MKVKFMGVLLACCCATDSYGQFWNKEYSLGNLFGGVKRARPKAVRVANPPFSDHLREDGSRAIA